MSPSASTSPLAVAGNGADMIRPDVMQAFVDAFHEAGFAAKSFLPSYGLAEATLAVSLMPPGEGIVVELVEETAYPAPTRSAIGRSATGPS
jgi:fatty-acyl-CoA synthase